jgi:glycosyltransferase involved in cell wall biosynthesis
MTVRVLHYVDSDTFGGTERSLLQLAEGLTRRGFESAIRCHQEPDLARLRSAAEAKGLAIRQVPRSAAWKTPRLFWQLVRDFRTVRPTIVHVHMPWVLSCRDGVAAAKLARVPVVVATVQLWIPERQTTVVHFKHRMLSRWIDTYVAVSRGIAAQLSDEYGVPKDKIRVVYNGASILPRRSSSATPRPERPLRVLTIARLHPQKGLDDLIRAAARVPDALFSIAGDGPERHALEECARRLRVADRVSFLGFREDVADLLDACDVFVLPSLFEGFPLVLLEAMAREKPIIATAVPGIEEVLQDGAGITIPPRDPDALALAITALAADPERARRLAAKGRERVETSFSVERMVDSVAQVYEDALDRIALPR